MNHWDIRLARATLVAASLVVAVPAVAQQYPAKPLKIIVPFAPGGGTDFIARFIAHRLAAGLGEQVVVENRPGAGGTIGAEAVIKSPPDGYTLALISNSYTVNPSLYPLRYDPVRDMTPVIQISRGPYVVVVHPAVQAKTIAELVAVARARPGEIHFASAGQGSVGHLATELLTSMAGIKLNHVPYKGTGPALTDTIAGQTHLLLAGTAASLQYVRAGRLRALAVTTAQRLPAEPDIPTVAESGVPGYEVVLWHGLIGPKGLPPAVVDRISTEVKAILKLRDTAEQLQSDGVSPAGASAEEFADAIKKEIEVWRKIVKGLGLKVE